MKIDTVKFVKSVNSLKNRPEALPEVCFIGRSNVGKSSLINMILSQKISKISATPGKTRFLNYFLINDYFYFVDLPGYGYAKISKEEQEKWQSFLTGYLQNNRSLKMSFQLIDIRHEYKNNDKMMIDFLDYYNIPYTIILTKSDKLGQEKLIKQINYYKKIFENKKVIVSSADKNIGRKEILEEISNYI